MKLISGKLSGTLQLLTWDNVQLLDDTGAMVPNVQKIVLTIEAGDIAVLKVDTYGVSSDPNAIVNCNDNGPVTSTTTHYVQKIDVGAASIPQFISEKIDDSLDVLRQQRISKISSINELEL
jgi:hypothetical protein